MNERTEERRKEQERECASAGAGACSWDTDASEIGSRLRERKLISTVGSKMTTATARMSIKHIIIKIMPKLAPKRSRLPLN